MSVLSGQVTGTRPPVAQMQRPCVSQMRRLPFLVRFLAPSKVLTLSASYAFSAAYSSLSLVSACHNLSWFQSRRSDLPHDDHQTGWPQVLMVLASALIGTPCTAATRRFPSDAAHHAASQPLSGVIQQQVNSKSSRAAWNSSAVVIPCDRWPSCTPLADATYLDV